MVSPLHTNLQVANFQRCKHVCQPLYASCCTILLCFSRYCTIRFKMFYFYVYFLCMYYFFKKCYKPITAQYYTAYRISWVPRLTLLDLGTNRTYECTLRMEFVHMWGLIYYIYIYIYILKSISSHEPKKRGFI